jgi:hypothetical protein
VPLRTGADHFEKFPALDEYQGLMEKYAECVENSAA